jgi:hypothetical protein
MGEGREERGKVCVRADSKRDVVSETRERANERGDELFAY